MDDGLDALIQESAAQRRNGNRRDMNIPTGKAGEIVAELERRLIMGYYKAGENLSFKMLADTFEVSRQPVSAAIGHLRASGYVEVLPQVGCRVVKPSREEVFDFFRIHSAIEATAVELAVERKTKGGVAQLRSIKPPPVKDLGVVPARAAYIRYIDAFHEQVWAMAKAPMIEGQFGGMRNLASFYLWQGISSLAPQIANVLNQERTKIADLIAAGDKEGAANLMRSHILGKPALVFD
jgi:DNA-binding GntR family transcriptional regulator